jgi:hypothetical protein
VQLASDMGCERPVDEITTTSLTPELDGSTDTNVTYR